MQRDDDPIIGVCGARLQWCRCFRSCLNTSVSSGDGGSFSDDRHFSDGGVLVVIKPIGVGHAGAE
jgi:hypothetical protein